MVLKGREATRAGVLTDLVFQYAIVRLVCCWSRGKGAGKSTARWSDSEVQALEMRGIMPVEHTRSSAGPRTCCVVFKQSSRDRKSVVSVQLVEPRGF